MDVGGIWRLLAVTLVATVGCANVEPPPGGPEDNTPPAILATQPEDEAIVPGFDGPVVFAFDERISEQGVEEAVIVSPRTSPVRVGRGRSEIRVSLREGWEADRIYHVTLGPEVRDLFSNRIGRIATVVFSTGPAIPSTLATGAVEDRISGRVQADVRVEAIRTADSLVYAVPTDTAGIFELDRFPAGDYLIRAFDDVNRNRVLDPYEPRDSAFVEVVEEIPASLTLRLLEQDSTAPVAGSADFRQRRITIEFDDYLDPEQRLDSPQVTVTGPAGIPVEVARVTVGTAAEIFPAADVAADTAATEALPSQQLVIELADTVEVVPEGEYTVRLFGIVNVHGLAADVEVVATAPAAAGAGVALVSRVASDRYIARRTEQGKDPEPRTVLLKNDGK